MRILCVTNLFPNPLQPGKGNFNWRELKLISERFPLRVISPILWVDALRGLGQGKRLPDRRAWQEWNGVTVTYPLYYYTPGFLRQHYGAFYKASIGRAFRRAIADFQPDLVYACWAYPDGWATWRLARRFGLPIVVKTHGSDLLSLGHWPRRRESTREIMQHADCVIAVSRNLRDKAISLGTPEQRAHVVYSGTDRVKFSPGDRTAARQQLGHSAAGCRMLLVANLVAVKGITHFIKACDRLIRSGLDVSADIVGEGPLRRRLQHQITRLGLADRVKLRGQQPNAELVHWYRAADVVVLSSHSEGIPNVLVEAAACGTAFVATEVGGVPEIAHLAPSRLCPPGDSAALAAAIASLLADPARDSHRVAPAAVPSVIDSVNAKLSLFAEVLAARETDTRRRSETGE